MKMKSPECLIDILLTLGEIGHRLTRAALLSALETKGRRWSEGTVGACLSQAVDIALLTNRQDTDIKGYGPPGWE